MQALSRPLYHPLPTAAQGHSSQGDAGATTAPSVSRAARVLVVDDDVMMRRLVTRVLEASGYEALMAHDASEALTQLVDSSFDVIITDLDMPGMDGIAFCRLVQRRLAMPVHIIILSGHGGHVVTGLEAGAADYMHKPFVPSELMARVAAGVRIVEKQKALLATARQLRDSWGEIRIEQERVERELIAAAALQSALLPPARSRVEGIDIACSVEPGSILSGDMVGILAGRPGQASIFSLDVSGNGAPAALLATLMTHEIRSLAAAPSSNRDDGGAGTGSALLGQLNRKFLDWANSDRYSTLAFATLDRIAGAAQISVAGHPRPAIMRADGSVAYVGDGGYPIGMLANATYCSTRVALAAGDRIVLFTDGFLESRLPGGACVGYEGMAELLRSVAGLETAQVAGALVQAFRNATRGQAGDDISIIIAGYA